MCQLEAFFFVARTFENHCPTYAPLVGDKLQAPVATFPIVWEFIASLSSLCSLVFVK